MGPLKNKDKAEEAWTKCFGSTSRARILTLQSSSFNSDIRNEPQERQNGRGRQGVGIGKMVKNYGFIYFFLDK
jgi:hypothetical protein